MGSGGEKESNVVKVSAVDGFQQSKNYCRESSLLETFSLSFGQKHSLHNICFCFFHNITVPLLCFQRFI